MKKITDKTKTADVIRQARDDGAVVGDDAVVYKISDEHTGLYAITDKVDFVFLEDGGGLYVPDDKYALIDAINTMGHIGRGWVTDVTDNIDELGDSGLLAGEIVQELDDAVVSYIRGRFAMAPAIVADAAQQCFNCREAEVDDAGDVHIADPQSGHWLDGEDLVKLAEWIEEVERQPLHMYLSDPVPTPAYTGAEFKALIKSRGLTQQQAADLLGLSLSSIAKRISGAVPSRPGERIALRSMEKVR